MNTPRPRFYRLSGPARRTTHRRLLLIVIALSLAGLYVLYLAW